MAASLYFSEKIYLEIIGLQNAASEIFTQVKKQYYFLFSKGGFTQWVREEAEKRGDVTLISVDDLFEISLKK